jgi:uncharacterized membrane protein YcaP (DUF421 family)
MLVMIQFIVAWLSARWRGFDRVVKSQPALLFYRGQFLHGAIRAERVTEGEVVAAVREQGYAVLEDVEAVVLETAGTFSVLCRAGDRAATALRDVRGIPGGSRVGGD